MKKHSHLSIILYAILACFIWSTAFIGIKIGFQYTKPLSFAGIRFILSGIILIPFCGRFSSFIKTVILYSKTIFLVGFFQCFLVYGLFYTAMTIVPAAIAAIIIGASPLVFAVASHIAFKDDKLTINKMLCIITGITGIVIITASRRMLHLSGNFEVIGIVLIIFSSISSAIGSILVVKDKHNINLFILNSAQFIFGGTLLLFLSFFIEGAPDFAQPFPYYASLFWLAAVSASAFSIWFYLLKLPGVKVSELNLWKFVIPVSGAALSWLILPEESPTLSAVAGMVLVAVSIIFYNLSILRARRQAGNHTKT